MCNKIKDKIKNAIDREQLYYVKYKSRWILCLPGENNVEKHYVNINSSENST